jgi:hypothetical protein
MAHYAFLNENNIVTEVITGKEETELIDGLSPEEWYGNYRGQKCVRTSYNDKIRYNYAGIGYTYDPIDDAFIAPKPYPSWVLNSKKQWEPPIAHPTDGKLYAWDEESGEWHEARTL